MICIQIMAVAAYVTITHMCPAHCAATLQPLPSNAAPHISL